MTERWKQSKQFCRSIDEAGLIDTLRQTPAGQRSLVALAGAPASGKSTMAKAIVAALNKSVLGRAACLQMDGFHLSNAILQKMGRLSRKGAPDTFDVMGLVYLLKRLHHQKSEDIFVPVFDRKREIAEAAGSIISEAVEIVIVEGNYLLIDHPPWQQMREFFDISVMISVSEQECRYRLQKRWQSEGLTPSEIDQKIDGNDIPNMRFVRANSREPDFVVHSGDTIH